MKGGMLLLAVLLFAGTARADDGLRAAHVGLYHAQSAPLLPAPGRLDARIGVVEALEAEVAAQPIEMAAPLAPVALPAAVFLVSGRDSLPDGMPLLARALWGRHGLVRVLGLAPSSRRAELRTRRWMLGWHQRLALVTLGAFTTQVVLGEMIAADPAKYHEDLQPVHRTLGYTTFGLYTTTASLSIFAPPARRYDRGVSAINIHRALAAVHFTGMMLMPWLGRRLSNAGSDYDHRLAQHRWVGRITYGAFLGAFATIVFAH